MPEIQASDRPYKIYEYVLDHGTYVDQYLPPHTIDYIKDVEVRFFSVRVFVLGEMLEVTYYATQIGTAFSEPVVRETYVYDRDTATGMLNTRMQTIEWYLDNGSIGPYPKIRGPKPYPGILEKRDEMKRRKQNCSAKASEVVIMSLLMQGMTPAVAIQAGQLLWASLTDEISNYENGQRQPLESRLNNDTEPTWLPAVKDAVLAELA